MDVVGRRFPFTRWPVLRMGLGIRTLEKEWQVGDGREAALQRYVLARAKARDLDDAAIARAKPKLLLELGTYCGYSALRTIRAAPADAHLVTIEFNAANAAIARAIFAHAGIEGRATIVHGTLGDGGATVAKLREAHGFGPGKIDFAFIDHAKDAYLPDIELILREGWLRKGAVVVADNVKLPGAPDYHRFMKSKEGTLFRTREHETHAEYQTLLEDIVLESDFLG